ncbi:MAG: hypothetical protein E7384_02970 [Ruminococcaceae bacterium]|nr:hypothetical protein [Oscillospiraceae bacterium]
MAKADNGQKLFGTEFNGFNKKQVTEYIALLEQKYNEVILQKDEETNALEVSYNELQDKYAELFDSYMALQEEKARIADVLIGAENRAAEIVEQARTEADKERAILEAQSENLRETIVDKNKILKDMKASANSMVSEFQADINAMVQEICAMLDQSITKLNEKTDAVIGDVAEKNAESKVVDEASEYIDEEISENVEGAAVVDDGVPAEESEKIVDEEVVAIFSDEEESNDGDFLL